MQNIRVVHIRERAKGEMVQRRVRKYCDVTNSLQVRLLYIGNGNPVRITSFKPVDCEGFPVGLLFYRQ